jgi:hypothetical protein
MFSRIAVPTINAAVAPATYKYLTPESDVEWKVVLIFEANS